MFKTSQRAWLHFRMKMKVAHAAKVKQKGYSYCTVYTNRKLFSPNRLLSGEMVKTKCVIWLSYNIITMWYSSIHRNCQKAIITFLFIEGVYLIASSVWHVLCVTSLLGVEKVYQFVFVHEWKLRCCVHIRTISNLSYLSKLCI